MKQENDDFKVLLREVREWMLLQGELGKKRFFLPPHLVLEREQDRVSTYPREESVRLSKIQNGTRCGGDSVELQLFQEFRLSVLKCVKCPLSKGRKQVVFGTGNEKAELFFVGEAPGFDEDRLGEPFVGKAGVLLTKMIQAMGLSREEVYIANIIKCRPPDNRTPAMEEIEECLPYLQRQIQHIRPKVICALGNVAVQTLLKTDRAISKLRGMFHEFEGIKLMPTFHPAFLLRNPESKREVWRDLQLIMEELGIKPK